MGRVADPCGADWIDAADILETLPDAFCALDEQGCIGYANQQACTVWGRKVADVLGCPIETLFPEQTRPELLHALAQLTEGQHRRLQATGPDPDHPIEFDIHRVRSGPLIYFRDIGARLCMETEIRKRHELLRLAEESAGIGIWDADLRTGKVWGTPQFYHIMGAEPSDDSVSVELPRQFRVPEDQQRVASRFQQAIETGADTFDSEYRVQRPDGETRWVFGRGRIIRNDAGVPVRYSGIDIDITDRKAAEEALRESEERFRRIFEQSPLGKSMMDADFRLRAVNPALCHMLGYASAELIGRTLADFVHTEDVGHCLDAGHSLLEGTPPQVQRDVRFIRKSGEVIWVRMIVGPIRAPDGQLLNTLGIFQDIDENRRVLEALRQSQERLRRLNESLEQKAEERARQLASSRAQLQAFFDNSPDWLTLQRATPDGQFIFIDINPTSEAAYGLSRDEVIGRTVPEIIGEEGCRIVVANFAECVRTGEPQRYRTRRTMAGVTRTIDVMVVLVPTVGENGDRFLITTARDITESEEIEAQLRQAQKMEAVGQLTGGIAHDFNNLLTGISGNLELLRNALEKGRLTNAGRFVESAARSTERAAALTHRLLAFARRQPLDPKTVEANTLLASMEDMLRRTLGPAIDLRMRLLDGLWPILCDPNQLENAILNLAINARDAMPNGGRLTLETMNTDLDAAYARGQGGEVKPGPYIAISVSDNGVGMAPQVAAMAFEPFFTTKPTGQGTGLGLSMLYGFVKQSGGHVRIYSEVGHGTTVRLYLPRYVPQGSGREAPGDALLPATPRPSCAGETVLVIEDEPAIHELISDALRDLGYMVLAATDGPSGLQIVQSPASIDLLITDVGLPGGLNGRQVADAARVSRPNMKVLFITGFAYGAALGRGAALEPGMEIMTKPFTLDALAAKVQEMIATPL